MHVHLTEIGHLVLADARIWLWIDGWTEHLSDPEAPSVVHNLYQRRAHILPGWGAPLCRDRVPLRSEKMQIWWFVE